MATNNAINLPGPTPVFSTALSSTAYNVTGFGLSPLSGLVANYYGPNDWLSFEGSIIVPLSVGNTISVTVQGYGETSDNDGILGALPSVAYQTTFSGFMIAQV